MVGVCTSKQLVLRQLGLVCRTSKDIACRLKEMPGNKRKEVWYEEKQQQYYEPPVKKVKLKRKRATKPDPNDEQKAEKAAATGQAQPAVHPPPEMQVSQDIIPAPDPQVFRVKYMFGTPGGRGVARDCKAVAWGLDDLGGCIQAVS